MSDTDLELLRRARGGDDSALLALVDRHARSLFGLAFSLVGNVADAEDVVQETFLAVCKRLGSFEGRSSVKTWLVRIAVRQAARCRRFRQSRKAVSIDEGLALAGREEGAKEMDMRMDVLAALETLSPDHREVVVLREMEGMTYEEMAEVLDVPRGTVESRLFRARQELKERLKDYMP